jgi:hypothetical protein
MWKHLLYLQTPIATFGLKNPQAMVTHVFFHYYKTGVYKSQVPGPHGKQFCMAVPHICGYLAWNLIVNPLAPRILKWLKRSLENLHTPDIKAHFENTA